MLTQHMGVAELDSSHHRAACAKSKCDTATVRLVSGV